jgi:hypothetical protein
MDGAPAWRRAMDALLAMHETCQEDMESNLVGRPVLRRLEKAECAKMVRDRLFINFKPTDAAENILPVTLKRLAHYYGYHANRHRYAAGHQ